MSCASRTGCDLPKFSATVYRRQQILAETNVAYAALRDDPAAWEEIEQEQRAWMQHLMMVSTN